MTHNQALQQLRELTATLAEYAGSEQALLTARFFGALAEIYRHDLVATTADQLSFRQALAQQAEMMQRFFNGEDNADPRI